MVLLEHICNTSDILRDNPWIFSEEFNMITPLSKKRGCLNFLEYDNGIFVNISYARLDIISVQYKFTIVAYEELLKETQSQDIHNIDPGKPSRGKKPIKTFFV